MGSEKREIITIDGPAASGKSTTARLVAKKLGWLYLDTGAMYRAITVKVIDKSIPLEDAELIGRTAEETELKLAPSDSGTKVFIDGKEITGKIRTPEIDRAVGPVCEVDKVRKVLVEQQRKIGSEGRVVAEGRDMGTVVFPDAKYKFYMIASIESRAKRRQKDLLKQNIQVPLDELMQEIERRDNRDSSRDNSPLKKADDAVLIDTSNLSIEQQVDVILKRVKSQGK